MSAVNSAPTAADLEIFKDVREPKWNPRAVAPMQPSEADLSVFRDEAEREPETSERELQRQSLAEMIAAGQELTSDVAVSLWKLADLAARVEAGHRTCGLKDFAAGIGLSYSRCKQLRRAALTYPEDKRLSLSVDHHLAAAKCQPEARDKLLKRAVKRGWSVRDLARKADAEWRGTRALTNPRSPVDDEPEPFHIILATGEFKDAIRRWAKRWPEDARAVVPDILRDLADQLDLENDAATAGVEIDAMRRAKALQTRAPEVFEAVTAGTIDGAQAYQDVVAEGER